MLWLLLLTALGGAENNLLQNGGFEQVAAGAPGHWDLFIMEEATLTGADAPLGGVDTAAREGARSVFLHNPAPYRSEPYNNWSQIVWDSPGGKKIRVAGSIKTEGATGAAIWAQCWQRTPYRLLNVASTSDRAPLSGTTDWREVEITVDVPAATDFVMVRCVLRGQGKAWFDGLSVTELAAAPAAPAAPANLEPPAEPAPKPVARPDTEELDSVLESLRSASKANEDLLVQVESLHQEIQALREQLQALGQAAAEVQAPEPPAPDLEPLKKVPPLVPHGMKPEDFP